MPTTLRLMDVITAAAFEVRVHLTIEAKEIGWPSRPANLSPLAGGARAIEPGRPASPQVATIQVTTRVQPLQGRWMARRPKVKACARGRRRKRHRRRWRWPASTAEQGIKERVKGGALNPPHFGMPTMRGPVRPSGWTMATGTGTRFICQHHMCHCAHHTCWAGPKRHQQAMTQCHWTSRARQAGRCWSSSSVRRPALDAGDRPRRQDTACRRKDLRDDNQRHRGEGDHHRHAVIGLEVAAAGCTVIWMSSDPHRRCRRHGRRRPGEGHRN